MIFLQGANIVSTRRRSYGRSFIANGVHCPCDMHEVDFLEITQMDKEYSFHDNCIERYILNAHYQYGTKFWFNDEYWIIRRNAPQYTLLWTMTIGRCNAASFDVGVGWSNYHAPYPEISRMTIKVFGVTVRENAVMPCGSNTYEIVAHVEVDGQGDITVTPISSLSSSNAEDELQ